MRGKTKDKHKTKNIDIIIWKLQFHWSLFQNGHRNDPHKFQKWSCVADPIMSATFCLGLRVFYVAGVGQCEQQEVGCRPSCPSSSASFGVAGVSSQGVGYTRWRPSGSASFTWQVWDNVSSPGVGCTPWRPSGSVFLRDMRGTMCIAKRSDVRPGP